MLDGDPYHQAVLTAASEEVLFPGAVYEPVAVRSLRYHSRVYVHGHTVGGTNPSLVEAMAAGNPVIAHDNRYNRWVAGAEARYFSDIEDLSATLDEVLDDRCALERMALESSRRHAAEFTWEHVASEYEHLLQRLPAASPAAGERSAGPKSRRPEGEA